MKKLFLSMAAVLLSSMAFAQSYTLNFVECEKTENDGSSVYSKGNSDAEYIANVFGETDKVASIVSRDNVYPARIGCGAKFGTSSKKGILAFTLATPTEVDSIVFSAAMYSKTEGTDGFKAINVLAEDTAAFPLSAGNKVFEDCVWKPAGMVTTVRINQTTAANTLLSEEYHHSPEESRTRKSDSHQYGCCRTRQPYLHPFRYLRWHKS